MPELIRFADDHRVTYRIELEDVERARRREADPLPLADGVARQARVFPQNVAVPVEDGADCGVWRTRNSR